MAVISHITFGYRAKNDYLTVRNSIFCLGAEFLPETVHVYVLELFFVWVQNFCLRLYTFMFWS